MSSQKATTALATLCQYYAAYLANPNNAAAEAELASYYAANNMPDLVTLLKAKDDPGCTDSR